MMPSPHPRSLSRWFFASLLLSVKLAASACGSPDLGNGGYVHGQADTTAPQCQPQSGNPASCGCSNDDYAPRFNASKNDTWPACAADAGIVRLIGPSLPPSGQSFGCTGVDRRQALAS